MRWPPAINRSNDQSINQSIKCGQQNQFWVWKRARQRQADERAGVKKRYSGVKNWWGFSGSDGQGQRKAPAGKASGSVAKGESEQAGPEIGEQRKGWETS